jgi:hypothetical protein
MAFTLRLNCETCDCTCTLTIEKTWDVRYCPSCGSEIEINEDDVIDEDVNFDEWDDDDLDLSR